MYPTQILQPQEFDIQQFEPQLRQLYENGQIPEQTCLAILSQKIAFFNAEDLQSFINYINRFIHPNKATSEVLFITTKSEPPNIMSYTVSPKNNATALLLEDVHYLRFPSDTSEGFIIKPFEDTVILTLSSQRIEEKEAASLEYIFGEAISVIMLDMICIDQNGDVRKHRVNSNLDENRDLAYKKLAEEMIRDLLADLESHAIGKVNINMLADLFDNLISDREDFAGILQYKSGELFQKIVANLEEEFGVRLDSPKLLLHPIKIEGLIRQLATTSLGSIANSKNILHKIIIAYFESINDQDSYKIEVERLRARMPSFPIQILLKGLTEGPVEKPVEKFGIVINGVERTLDAKELENKLVELRIDNASTGMKEFIAILKAMLKGGNYDAIVRAGSYGNRLAPNLKAKTNEVSIIYTFTRNQIRNPVIITRDSEGNIIIQTTLEA